VSWSGERGRALSPIPPRVQKADYGPHSPPIRWRLTEQSGGGSPLHSRELTPCGTRCGRLTSGKYRQRFRHHERDEGRWSDQGQ